jgi:3',5'-cyclic AMP phosphodiesterase CpdA
MLLCACILVWGCVPRIGVRRLPTLEYPVELAELENWSLTSEREFRNLDPNYKAPSDTSDVVLTFVHVSDVQIRDFSLIYHNDFLSAAVDLFVKGTERRVEVDTAEEYPFLVLVKTINKLEAELIKSHPKERPAFMIHTGDAIEAGTVGELLRFLSVANRSAIPWFNVIGNHDILTFGNFAQGATRVDGLVPGLEMITDRTTFMRLHRGEGSAAPYAGVYGMHSSSRKGNDYIPGTEAHGFDCDSTDLLRQSGDASTCQGGLRSYYSFSTRTDPPLRIIALDTTIPDTEIFSVWSFQVPGVGAGGFIGEEQMTWLRAQLADAKRNGEAVLVFGHHPLSWRRQLDNSNTLDHNPPRAILKAQYRAATRPVYLADFLKSYDNVLGYFGGHTHKVGLFRHTFDPGKLANMEGRAFAEVIAPSLHEFPLSALLVRVIKAGRDLSIEVSPIDIGANDTDGKSKLAQVCAGARLESGIKGNLPCLVAEEEKEKYKLSLLSRAIPDPRPAAKIDSVVPGRICPQGVATIEFTLEGVPPFRLGWSDDVVRSLDESDLKRTGDRTWKGRRNVTPVESTVYAIRDFSDNNISGIVKGSSVKVDVTKQLYYTQDPSPVCFGDKIVYTAPEGNSYSWFVGDDVTPRGRERRSPEIGVIGDSYPRVKLAVDACEPKQIEAPEIQGRPKVVSLTVDRSEVCKGDFVTLEAELEGKPEFKLRLSDGTELTSSTSTVALRAAPNATQDYRIVGLADAFCKADEDRLRTQAVAVRVYEKPSLSDQSLTFDGSRLTVNSLGVDLSYRWYKRVADSEEQEVGQNSPAITPDQSGVYRAVVYSGPCVVESERKSIEIEATPPAEEMPPSSGELTPPFG